MDELKRELEALKAEGGMSALRELLQMKVEELEKCRQAEPGPGLWQPLEGAFWAVWAGRADIWVGIPPSPVQWDGG